MKTKKNIARNIFIMTSLMLIAPMLINAQINVDGSNNVGIANASPTQKFCIGTISSTYTANISAAQVGYIGQSGAGFAYNGTGSTGYALLAHSNGNTYINNLTNGAIVFRAQNVNEGAWTPTGLGIGTTTPNYSLELVSNSAGKPTSSTWTITSDSRTKTNVATYKHGLDLVRKVKLISYEYNGIANTPKGEKGIGVLAQDFQTVFPNSVKPFTIKTDSSNAGGTYFGVDLHELFVSNVGAVQQLDSIVSGQAKLLSAQDSIIKALQTQVARIISTCCPLSLGRQEQNGINSTTLAERNVNVTLADANAVVLNQNVPNPFAEQTVITYNVPVINSSAQILFYNTNGTLIKTVDIKTTGAGQLTVFANDLSNGIYSYTLVVDGAIMGTKKMVKQQ